jgi:hypothetical protein
VPVNGAPFFINTSACSALGTGWVPGVFRPDYNRRFTYEPYDGTSYPSVFTDYMADISSASNTELMDPYSRVQTVNTYASTTSTTTSRFLRYNNQAFNATTSPAYPISNGLCFWLSDTTNGKMRIDADRAGTAGSAIRNVAVEVLRNNTSSNMTGPIIAVILDEKTRRPIPRPTYQLLYNSDTGSNGRRQSATSYQLISSSETWVNSLIISGIVPSREYQSFGGLSNFPRFLEHWSGIPLKISGSLIQLNFSNYATGPFTNASFDAPNHIVLSPGSGYEYYFPPNREWGYDVGLQFAAPSEVAERIQQNSPTKAEFLTELNPDDDPYIRRLRCELQDELPGVLDDNPTGCP